MTGGPKGEPRAHWEAAASAAHLALQCRPWALVARGPVRIRRVLSGRCREECLSPAPACSSAQTLQHTWLPKAWLLSHVPGA